jgi:hypothetical protein
VEYLGDNEVLHFEDRITDAAGELVSTATSTFVSFPAEERR